MSSDPAMTGGAPASSSSSSSSTRPAIPRDTIAMDDQEEQGEVSAEYQQTRALSESDAYLIALTRVVVLFFSVRSSSTRTRPSK